MWERHKNLCSIFPDLLGFSEEFLLQNSHQNKMLLLFSFMKVYAFRQKLFYNFHLECLKWQKIRCLIIFFTLFINSKYYNIIVILITKKRTFFI